MMESTLTVKAFFLRDLMEELMNKLGHLPNEWADHPLAMIRSLIGMLKTASIGFLTIT